MSMKFGTRQTEIKASTSRYSVSLSKKEKLFFHTLQTFSKYHKKLTFDRLWPNSFGSCSKTSQKRNSSQDNMGVKTRVDNETRVIFIITWDEGT